MDQLNYSTDSLPSFKKTLVSHGKPFTYSVTKLTEKCWLIEADYNTGVAQVAGVVAYRKFFDRLQQHLDEKYGGAA